MADNYASLIAELHVLWWQTSHVKLANLTCYDCDLPCLRLKECNWNKNHSSLFTDRSESLYYRRVEEVMSAWWLFTTLHPLIISISCWQSLYYKGLVTSEECFLFCSQLGIGLWGYMVTTVTREKERGGFLYLYITNYMILLIIK